ncbi:MAG TPA: SDR family oxidoreductase [Candidatus Lokiarchaeia archaeon]|nr:SDR family oxidoreductase [Candidatus Lokiarchaeia archaeon]
MIVGCTGMLGSSIMLAETNHQLFGTYVGDKPRSKNIHEMDITNSAQVIRTVEKFKPEAIINTAAITNVDLCEEKPDIARSLHVEGTKNLVDIARKMDLYFLYISTDSVFDGNKGNYSELDDVNPPNVYAQTKYEGELEALAYDNASVARTNIYGLNWLPKESIAEWILHSLRLQKEITLFEDVSFTPILTNFFADVLFNMIEKRVTGIFHVAGTESITKLDFGLKIASIYGVNPDCIRPISISEFNFKAPRPLNPTLNCTKIQETLRLDLMNVEQGLRLFKDLETGEYALKLKAF